MEKVVTSPEIVGIDKATPATSGYLFLTSEWVHEVTRVVQGARSTNPEFGKMTGGFSLGLVYLVNEFPPRVKEQYGCQQLAIFIRVEKGVVRRMAVGPEPPPDKVDFTVTSNYSIAKKIFQGEWNAASCFVNRQIKVEPLSRVYKNPRFTARSIVAGNALLKVARQVPTVYAPE